MTDPRLDRLRKEHGQMVDLLLWAARDARPHAFEELDHYDPALIAAIHAFPWPDNPDTAWEKFLDHMAEVGTDRQLHQRVARRALRRCGTVAR